MSVVLDLQIATQSQEGLPDHREIACWIEAAVGRRVDEGSEVTVRLVDAAEMAELNLAYRHQAGTTNVLSFPFEAPAEVDLALLGDIIICRQVVEAEAVAQQKSLTAHWAHLVIHGALHLTGYDHLNDKEAEEMETLEIAILAGLGFANPYEQSE
ncbi:MAG: rRNA maturation RNase YbeY [Gammaproteobacteria bacterium]|nr:rRNA maturation RNase YbeY [Gammaproteobacteria bacterium]